MVAERKDEHEMHKYTHVESVTHVDRYVRQVNGDPECPEQYKICTPVQYRGTVKLHGTNGGICCKAEGLVPQSRERVLELGKDEHGEKRDYKGFAAFVWSDGVTAAIREIEAEIRETHDVDPTHELYLYGEWCGPGIEEGMAINDLPEKQWVFFGVRVYGPDRDEYLDAVGPFGDRFADVRVHSIMDGPVWDLEIDFLDPESKQAGLDRATEIVTEVERGCPWGARFGIEGLGEGVVWIPVGDHWGRKDLYFKVKGEKHSKVKTRRERPEVAPEVLEGIAAFVDFGVTEARLQQGIEVLREHGKPLEMRSMGDFLKWVSQDVLRECVAELEASGLEWKQVAKAVATRARDHFAKTVQA